MSEPYLLGMSSFVLLKGGKMSVWRRHTEERTVGWAGERRDETTNNFRVITNLHLHLILPSSFFGLTQSLHWSFFRLLSHSSRMMGLINLIMSLSTDVILTPIGRAKFACFSCPHSYLPQRQNGQDYIHRKQLEGKRSSAWIAVCWSFSCSTICVIHWLAMK